MSTRPTILDDIPDPATIRAMIADHIREASLLRGLLRVAERQQKIRVRPGPTPARPPRP